MPTLDEPRWVVVLVEFIKLIEFLFIFGYRGESEQVLGLYIIIITIYLDNYNY